MSSSIFLERILNTKVSATILKSALVLIAMLSLGFLVGMPLLEGRAKTLDLFHIYTDPFILYGYAASISFFIALYKAYVFLGYIRNDKVFSTESVLAMKHIKYCALVFCVLIGLAAIYARIFFQKEDDPAGFLVLCTAIGFASFLVASGALLLENILQEGISLSNKVK